MEYPHIIPTTLVAGGTMAVGTSYLVACKVPSDSQGGALSVIAAGLSSRAAIAAGSSPMVELVYLSTAYAVLGTIGTVAAGAFTAGTPKAMTVTQTVVDADQFVAWKFMGTAANADQLYVTAWFTTVAGI